MIIPISWIGHHTVAIRLIKQAEREWMVSIQDGESIWEVPLASDVSEFLEPSDKWHRNAFKQNFLDQLVQPGAMKLLDIEAMRMIDLHKSFDPTFGLQIWIE